MANKDSKLWAVNDNIKIKLIDLGDGTYALASALTDSNSGINQIKIPDGNFQNRRMFPISNPTKLNIPTYDGYGQPVHPSVVYIAQSFGGYQYWMAFTPYTNSDSSVENPSIVASNDGLNWVVPTGVTNPLFGPPEVGFHADTELVYDDDNKKLYLYFGHFGAGAASTNYRSETVDGVTWSEPTPCVNLTGGYTYVRKSATDWIAWINNTTHRCIFKKTSTDGITWTDDANRERIDINIPCIPWHLSVYFDGSGYHFLLSAYVDGQPTQGYQNLYYGYSADGDDYIYFDDVPLLIPDKNGFPSSVVYKSHMVPFDNQTYRVYVSGYDLDGTWGMGYFDAQRAQTGSYELSKLARRGKGAVTYSREGELAAETKDDIVDTTEECYLEYLTFGTNIETCSFIIYVKDHHGKETPIRFAHKDGTKTEDAFKPTLVRVHKPPKFELVIDAAGTYAIQLKAGEKLYFPHGVKIRAMNSNQSPYNVALTATLSYKY